MITASRLLRILSLTLLVVLPVFVWAQANDDFIVTTLVGNDTTPPTVPSPLTATPVATTQIDVSWATSTDNWIFSGYQLFRAIISTTSTATPLVFSQIATTTVTSYSDAGLIASTTYAYYATAFDSFNNISASSNIAYATTLTPYVPPAEATSTKSSSSGNVPSEIVFLEVVPSEDGVIIRWRTARHARSTVRWGRTVGYELGSLVEQTYRTDHETMISGLEPGTLYYFQIAGENGVGLNVVMTEDSFTTLLLNDDQPPANVSNLISWQDGSDAHLSWTNPTDVDFAKVRVVRNDTFYPVDPFDGWVVYEGGSENIIDENVLQPGRIQYYSVFAYDENGNVSSGAVTHIAVPDAAGVVPAIGAPKSPGGTTDGSVGPDDASQPDTERVDKDLAFSLRDVVFIQDGLFLDQLRGNRIPINGAKQLTIEVPYDRLPEHLKSIIVSIQDPEDPSQLFSFLLRVDDTKSVYRAVVAPFGKREVYDTTLSIYDFDTTTLTQLQFSLESSIIYVRDKDGSATTGILNQIITSYLFWFLLVLGILFMIGRRLLFRG